MLKAEYIRKMNKSSFLLTPEKDFEPEKDSIEMLCYNEIPFFLHMAVQKKDMQLRFCYDITGRRSLDQLLEYKILDYGLLKMILHSFDQACQQMEDFMMTENDILLESEYIFTDHNMEHLSYCYLPGNQEDICGQFKKFMEYLLRHLDHKDEQAVALAYGVYQRVIEDRAALHDVLKEEKQMKEKYCFTKRRQISTEDEQITSYSSVWKHPEASDTEIINSSEQDDIREIHPSEECAAENISAKNVWQSKQSVSEAAGQAKYFGYDRPSEKAVYGKDGRQDMIYGQKEQNGQTEKIMQKEARRKKAAEKLRNMLRKKVYTDKDRYMEEDTVFEAEVEEPVVHNPTVCLVPDAAGIQNQFVYQGSDRSRDFQCTQGRLLLGSDMQESDICIPIPMVSRVHARLETDVQGTFLEDMNSTNGTLINGELLQYHERRLLQKGDIISLAGECYSFH